MAIDFNSLKNNTAAARSAAPAADRPKAQFWINIGYSQEVEVHVEGGGVEKDNRFVSLPVGIPLDTTAPIPVKGSNETYNAFVQARNSLLEQIMEFAKTLKPGEEKMLPLEIQLRRVNDEVAPVASASNPFEKKINFG